MKKTIIGVLASLFVTVSAFAEPLEPNYYVCVGEGVEMSYSTSSFIGKPMFNLSIEDEAGVNKMGNEIMAQRTAIGNLVSVYSELVPDAFTKIETLVLPDVNLKSIENSVKFDTQLVRTTHRSSIGGPSFLTGVLSKSEYIPVSCEASKVFF